MKHSVFFFLIFSFQTILSQSITLRDTTNQYDYVIITVPGFVTACEPFKQHKETVRDFRTLIVDTTQIFAEFDSSSTPQDNIRDFISYAGTFWKHPRPKYFLLAGNRSKLPNFDDILNFAGLIDTAHTDYKFSVNKFGIDSTFSSFQIGRIPAYSAKDLGNYFNKAINYEIDTVYANWMNNNLFMTQYYPDTLTNWTNVTNSIMSIYPDYFVNYFFTENDTSLHYGNRDSIINFLNTRGSMSLWLIGHTFNYQFGYYNIIDTGDVNNFTNNPKNFITFFILRQFFSTDDSAQGLADRLLMDENGSIAVVSPVGYVFSGQNNVFYYEIVQGLFGLDRKSIGAAFIESGNQFPNSYTRRMYNLWGDPSLVPKYDITAGTEVSFGNPVKYVLYQNYPNPFNPTTIIKYEIPGQARNDNVLVVLKIYDVLGNKVATLVNEEKPAGTYEVEFKATDLPSGVYLYQLHTGSFIQTKKMVLLK